MPPYSLTPSPSQAWGLDVIHALQSHNNVVLEGFFTLLSLLGTSESYYVLLSTLIWCWSGKRGVQVTALFLTSSYISGVVKYLTAIPRPFVLDPSVQLIPTSGFAFPSGHSLDSVVIWVTLALWVERRWLRNALLTLPFFIGLSRVWLGVHYPTDVLGGWAIGALILLTYHWLAPDLEQALAKLSLAQRLRLAVALPLVVMLLLPIPNAISSMAALAGLLAGYALELEHFAYVRPTTGKARARAWLIAATLFIGVHFALWALPVEHSSTLALGARAFRFAATWLAATVGAAWLLRRLKLVAALNEPDSSPKAQ